MILVTSILSFAILLPWLLIVLLPFMAISGGCIYIYLSMNKQNTKFKGNVINLKKLKEEDLIPQNDYEFKDLMSA